MAPTGSSGIQEPLFLVVLGGVLLLLCLALAFAAYAIVLRIRTNGREAHWAELKARWEEPVLNAVLDPNAGPELHALIAPEDQLRFVRFALEYSRRVRGEERETIRQLALPYLEPLRARVAHRRVEVRTRAVQTLGALGIPEYANEVLYALDDPSPVVAMVAARALCREEHPEYAPAVLARLGRFGLWSPGFLAALMAGVGPMAVPALRAALADPAESPAVRAVAADALRLLADLESGEVAAGVLESAEDRELVAAALRLISVVGQPEHVGVIRERCSSPDFFVRATACAALGTLAEEEDHPRLLAALSDPSPWVAIQAAQGLLSAGARALVSGLAESDHPRAALAQQVLLEAEAL